MCCNDDLGSDDGQDVTRLARTGEIINRLGVPTLAGQEIRVDATPSGPNLMTISRISRSLTTEWLRRDTSGADLRLLSMQVMQDDVKDRAAASHRFLAFVYDYTHNRTFRVCGPIDQPDRASVVETALQPLPNDEEFEAAVEMLANQSEFGPAIRVGELLPYRAMPPLVQVETPDGRIERTLAIGLVSREAGGLHRIVGVNMIRREVLHHLDEAALDSHDECGPASSSTCAFTGNTGRVSVTVTQGSTTLWQFDAIRPAASSGTNGSGIELRGVRYRGKQVLYQAHVPILNVEYYQDGINAGCGPTYRDWQNSETCFEAYGIDVIPGFRLCTAPAQTIIESGTDAGNFRGVAIFVQGQEAVLVSELQAGWYRYISQWRFHVDGTIRPRFGFAAANNPCTCKDHHHHVYWRLDFDIRTAGQNVAEEYNNPPLVGGSNWHTKRYEIRRPRDASRNRHWRIRNLSTDEGYLLLPGVNDGAQDAFGMGDFWVVRYRGTPEYDDGQGFTTDPALSRANIDRFVNGEIVEDRDVVVWYAGHFRHSPGHGGSLVGPDLKPFNW
jgi:Copper amine oxidase, enzyme domain